MNWKQELEEWEEYHKGDTDSLSSNIEEIENFASDPMFEKLTKKEMEEMKSNLVFFIKQVS